jgi:flagellar basal-body rod modification protein FlgD
MADTIQPGGGLGKDAFLQLMVTQMRYQDPLQPQDNSQFLAQLAQFTSLEQMTNISDANNNMLKSLQTMQQYSQLSFEHQLIGSTVTVATDTTGTTVTGQVKGIKMVNGDAQLIVGDNGNTYPLSAVQQME